FIGDAVMIFFGDPVSRGLKEDALACVRMSIAMQKRLDELADIWRNAGLTRPLRCRIGITTGYCTVGNFGSENRMDYTIIGGTVNLASRLESAAEPGTILISEETFGLVSDEIACDERDTITVKGIARPVKTYRVIDSREDMAAQPGRISEHHAKFAVDANIAAMSEEERREAARVLEKVLAEVAGAENDKPRS
ncbi:MAG: adenylate/guanylate cyclase domain-containing protein, partial [Bauldia sp.]|nr:adenylate/guanylate cyclase domain-containing protein [Bauldia sp.]